MIGKILANKYYIDSVVGSGGMATVYKAHILSNNKVVAIKVLKDEHKSNPDFVRRFEREARTVLSLSHENIVRSYDVGSEDGIYYIVLEYVVGKTLKEIMEDGGPLSPRVTVNLMCQVLDALSHAHGRGIIHRDVKPQNVIVTVNGKVKLTDFGIAREVNASTKTFAGSNVLGSVHYISPEQARGDDVGPSSDIYSAGIMMYEMLTGRLPFDGENTVSIALKHLHEEITPPIDINPNMPRALSDVAMKATSKQLDSRYGDALVMRKDLVRSLREPNGRFARQKAERARGARRNALWIIPVFSIVFIGLVVAMFFAGRSIANPNVTYNELIPQLTNKTIDEAKELAEQRGFSLVVLDWVVSGEYAEGIIMSQSPAAGASSSAGTKINVTVSSGRDVIVVPDLSGLTQMEALNKLDAESLKIGEINYGVSEMPEGVIFKQDPVYGTELMKGDTVDIFISGRPSTNTTVLDVVGDDLPNAIEKLQEKGFKRILVRTVIQNDAEENNIVLSQSPNSDLPVLSSTTIELSVVRKSSGIFASDIAFNLDIVSSDTSVMVTAVLEEGVEQVLYEGKLSTGNQVPISFVGRLTEAGDYTCIAYIDGIEARKYVAKFSFRS